MRPLPDGLWRLPAVAILGLSVVGCAVASASPTATLNAVGPSPASSASKPEAIPSPTYVSQPLYTRAATATPDLATSTPSPSPTVGPLPPPSIGPAPAGNWTALRWTSAWEAPVAEPATASDDAGNEPATFSVYGWSRGYLAFRSLSSWAMTTSAIYVASSSDGLLWKLNGQLDIAGLDSAGITGVAEGPAGLLATGRLIGSACGSAPNIEAMWRSSDGVAWRRIDMAGFKGGFVDQIEGGSAGYIATGSMSDPAREAVWTSADGIGWRAVDLAAKTLKGILVQNATAFSGGYVLAGSILSPDSNGCGGGIYLVPSLWWSPDGITWSRDQVAGVKPGTSAWMRVARITDHAVLATGWSQTGSLDGTSDGTSTTSTWTSLDGRTWKPISLPGLDNSSVVTDGLRGLVVGMPDEAGVMKICAIHDDLSVTELAQTGDLPGSQMRDDPWWTMAEGPAGLVIANIDGTHFWLGAPSAN